MDVKDYAAVIKLISTKLSIQPDETLIRNATIYCRQLNHKQLKSKYKVDDDRYAFMAESYIKSITQDLDEFDFKEYLRTKVSKETPDISSSLKNIEPLTNWIGTRMPIISSKSMSVYIDSRVRNVSLHSSGSITDFGFSLVPRQSRAEIGDGRVQVRVMPSQITYFKIGKLILPYDAVLRNRNYANEMTLTFTGMRSNGIIGREDTYHFAFTYKLCDNTSLVELTPVNDYCKFNPPLRIVDDLTLRFNDPVFPVSFLNDRLQPSQINYLTADGRITFSTPHSLVDNDIIIVMGLITEDDAANASILATINDPRGITITKITDTVISTGIDFTGIITPDIDSNPWILFYSRMFRFPLEIGYQDIVEL